MSKRQHELGDAELEVLKVLWDEGPAVVREVMNRLHQCGREVAYTTGLTLLTRLEQKGYVRSDKSGFDYVDTPVVSRERVTKARLRNLKDQLYDGAAAPMVLHLIRSERFSTHEIEQLHDLIDALDKKPKKTRKK